MGKSKKAVTETYHVSISENALRNMDEITGYIGFIDHDPLNAIKVGNRIIETIERIGLHPNAFQECSEIPTKNKRYRRAVCLSWHIIYKISGADIVILGILHTSRKPSAVKPLRKIK